jgi:hypothetical protein
LPKSRQLSITDTVARLRVIRRVIDRVDPQDLMTGKWKIYNLRFLTPEEAMPIMRQMLDLSEDKNSTADNSLRIAVDTQGKRLFASGKPEKIARLEELLKTVDAPKGGADWRIRRFAASGSLFRQQPIRNDIEGNATCWQACDVRMDIDPKQTTYSACPACNTPRFALPLAQMQQDVLAVEVIRLRLQSIRKWPCYPSTSFRRWRSGQRREHAAPPVRSTPSSSFRR